MPVSGSKQEASVLGCPFYERFEQLPIKKRKFLLRSLSPPPSTSPHPINSSSHIEETADLTNGQNVSFKHETVESGYSNINLSQIADNDINIFDKKSENANERYGEGERFSGKSILAAPVCGSSVGRHCEESLTQEHACEVGTDTEVPSSSKGLLNEACVNSSGTSCCRTTESVGERAYISTAVNLSPKVATCAEGKRGASQGEESLTLSRDVSCCENKEIVGNQRPTSQDDRFHWDLNVVMGAWEDSFDCPEAKNDVPLSISQDAGQIKAGANTNTLDGRSNSQDELSTACAEPRAMTNQSLEGTQDNHDMGACRDGSQTSTLVEKSDCKNNPDVVKCVVEETKCMHNGETVKPSDGSAVTVSDHVKQLPACGTVNEEDKGAFMKSLTLNGTSHHSDRRIMEGSNSTATVHSSELENCRSAAAVDATCSTASANMQITLGVSSTSDIQGNLAGLDNLKTAPALPCYENAALEEVKSSKTAEPLANGHITTLNGKGLPDSSCELLVASLQDIGNIQGGNSVQLDEMKMNLLEFSSVTSKETCDLVCHDYDTSTTNFDTRLNCSDNVDTLVCHDDVVDRTDVVGGELQEDFNSQYEDGELRETQERRLQHYDVDGEVEQVDYGSDMNMCSTISADYNATESGQVEDRRAVAISSNVCSITNEFGNTGISNREDVIPHDDIKLTSSHQAEETTKASRSRRLLWNVANGVGDDNGLVAETSVESRVFRRGLRSWIDVSSREERLHRYDEFGSTRSSGRGGRYNGPSRDESFQSSLKYRRPLSHRERSLSPFEGRGHSNAPPHHSRGKSPSQSRTLSPVMWNSPNRRPVPGSGTFFRRRSRSPNFRSEGRMQRLRSPHHHHHQRGFRPDHGAGGFRSFPRANGAPPPHSQWNSSSRKDEQGHFREFNEYKPRSWAIMDRSPSPGRMRNIRGGGDRANDVMGGSSRNVKPDGYYRIPEENYEDHRRKQHYGGRVRRPPARWSYEEDGNFSVGNNFIRDRDGGPSFQGRGGGGEGGLRGNIDNRIGDLPRRFRGGDQHHQQQSFRYEHGDGKFGSNNSKQFSVEGTKSEENYRSSAHNTGRFTENYEDRRKHFEKTLSNHNNVDENFEDGPDFQNRGGMRRFAGRIGSSLSNKLIREEDHKDPVCAQNEEKFDGNPESVGTL